MSDNRLPRRVFYMARHGETEDNAAGIVSAHKTPLTELGREQARSLREVVERVFEHPECCHMVTSQLDRARHTAQLAVPEGWSVHEAADHRLNERNNGNLEGVASYQQWQRLFNRYKGALNQAHDPTEMPGGIEFTVERAIHTKKRSLQVNDTQALSGIEMPSQHLRRIKKALREHLTECPEEKTPLFVCHSGVLKRVAQALGLGIRDDFANGGLYKFTPQADDSWTIEHVFLDRGGELQTEPMMARPIIPSAPSGNNPIRR